MSDLLGADVLDLAGTKLGDVHDVRLVQGGPLVGVFGASLRLRALLFGPTAVGVRLGFGRSDVRGPWPLRAAFAALHPRMRVATWEQISTIEAGRIRLRVTGDEVHEEIRAGQEAGRVLDAGLELLDRQMTDPDGLMAGNVDDLELTFSPEGGPPIVTDILSGPGALARRIGGRSENTIARIHERLQERGVEGPARVSFGVVVSIGSDVRLSVPKGELQTHRFEAWARDAIVTRIPGR